MRAVKAERDIQDIPVIIVSSTAREEDVHAAMSLQASLYLKKPLDAAGYEDVVRKIEEFWLDHVSQLSDPDTNRVGRSGKVDPEAAPGANLCRTQGMTIVSVHE